ADRADATLASHHLDLDVLAATTSASRITVADPAELPGRCDVVVVTASVPHRDGRARSDFLAGNAPILEDLLACVPTDWAGTLVTASNPVDSLCTLAARRLGPSTQVIGFSINDTLRLRCGIGRALGCPAADVEAWSAGEHGPHAVPLFSLVRVNGAPVR